jgi:hypothetical protein
MLKTWCIWCRDIHLQFHSPDPSNSTARWLRWSAVNILHNSIIISIVQLLVFFIHYISITISGYQFLNLWRRLSIVVGRSHSIRMEFLRAVPIWECDRCDRRLWNSLLFVCTRPNTIGIRRNWSEFIENVVIECELWAPISRMSLLWGTQNMF